MEHTVTVTLPPHHGEGELGLPAIQPFGLVLFAHGSGSSRHSPRNRIVAAALREASLATLLFDLLTEDEATDRQLVFDIPLLAGRLRDAAKWATRDNRVAALPQGYFGASTGAAATLLAAAEPDARVCAVVSRGGRPDLAGTALAHVRAPTLLIVGGADDVVLGLNRAAQGRMRCECRLTVVPGATHLFEEPGTLDEVVTLARAWFLRHLPRTVAPGGTDGRRG
ncbi:MAG: hydrolase [Rhodospirillales bacterium 70-18]|nr:alpha/beta hydrolase [Rhodospirillales bacterium]OJY66614.1 MAG: hydrolase [Rhodospirillales bacterium 70-18]